MTDPYRVLWEDDHLLVIDKPSGLRSIPDGYNSALPNLAGLLKAAYGQVWVVHRLDKDTSGVMVFGKSSAATSARLLPGFIRRRCEEVYINVIAGKHKQLWSRCAYTSLGGRGAGIGKEAGDVSSRSPGTDRSQYPAFGFPC